MASKETIRNAINSLLSQMMEKKLIAKQKELDALLAKGLSDTNPKVEAVLKSLSEVEDSYQYDKWLQHAAYNMTKSATLATHISKGVHSMSKGDSVLFKAPDDRPRHVAGSHNIISDVIDISGSAAALPIYNFINLEVGDVTIKQLIEQSDPAIISALSDNEDTAYGLFDKFHTFLNKEVDQPLTSEINKQLLFPKNGDSFDVESLDELEYETVVPLYASVFLHEVRNKINEVRFGDVNKEAIKNRYTQDADEELVQAPYKVIKNLATMKLGGSKPANISKVVVMSAGEMLLLPNKPPRARKISAFFIPKYISTIFDSVKIAAMLNTGLANLAYTSIAYDKHAVYKTKNAKRAALERVVTEIFDIALVLQKNKAGWLADHALPDYEKYWLDPIGMGISFIGMDEDEIELAQNQLKTNAVLMIANYVNNSLEVIAAERGIAHADIFDTYSFDDIRKEIEAMAKKFKRHNMEVFHDYAA